MTEARLVTREQLAAALPSEGALPIRPWEREALAQYIFDRLPAAAPAEGLPALHLEYDGEDEDAYVVTEDQRTVGVIRSAALARHESAGSE